MSGVDFMICAAPAGIQRVTPEWYIKAMLLYLDNRAAAIDTVSNELQCTFVANAVLGL